MKYNGNNTLNEIVETVEKLVSIKTTPSNYAEFERAVEYIENYYSDTSIKIEKHYFLTRNIQWSCDYDYRIIHFTVT